MTKTPPRCSDCRHHYAPFGSSFCAHPKNPTGLVFCMYARSKFSVCGYTGSRFEPIPPRRSLREWLTDALGAFAWPAGFYGRMVRP